MSASPNRSPSPVSGQTYRITQSDIDALDDPADSVMRVGTTLAGLGIRPLYLRNKLVYKQLSVQELQSMLANPSLQLKWDYLEQKGKGSNEFKFVHDWPAAGSYRLSYVNGWHETLLKNKDRLGEIKVYKVLEDRSPTDARARAIYRQGLVGAKLKFHSAFLEWILLPEGTSRSPSRDNTAGRASAPTGTGSAGSSSTEGIRGRSKKRAETSTARSASAGSMTSSQELNMLKAQILPAKPT